jgi:hypothetical protein
LDFYILIFKDETLAQCQVCNFAFCALCRQGYHGIEPCKITSGILNNNFLFKFIENFNLFITKMTLKRFVMNIKTEMMQLVKI